MTKLEYLRIGRCVRKLRCSRRRQASESRTLDTPIVLSQIPRNIWKDEKVTRASADYGKWAAEAAKAGGALFIDLNEIAARRYEQAGREKVKMEFFTEKDHTHTTGAGAKANAASVVDGIKALKDCPLAGLLAPSAEEWRP